MAKRISDQTVSGVCRAVAMMLEAGIAPEEAMDLLCERTQSPKEEAYLLQLRQYMEQGVGLAQAVRETQLLPDHAVKLLQVGETSGLLEEVLYNLAEEYQRRSRLKEQVKRAVFYPMVLLVLMCAVLAVLVFGVLPVFERVYNSLSGGFDQASYWYVAVAGIVGRSSLALVCTLCLLLLVGGLVARWEKGANALRSLAYHVPVIGTAFAQLEISRMIYVLATQSASGVDSDLALEEAGEQLHHPQGRQQFQTCQALLAQGEGLARSLSESELLSPLYGRICIAASQGGSLDATLSKVAEKLGQEAETSLFGVLEGIEPVLTIFLTIAIGLTLLSAMLPLVGILGGIG